MAYTFFKAQGLPVGKSLVEDDRLDSAQRRRSRARKRAACALELPVDHVVAPKLEAGAPTEVLGGRPTRRSAIAWASTSARRRPRSTRRIAEDAQTVVWNGPMGVFEIDEFAQGHRGRRARRRRVKGTTIVGGGDSIAAINKAGVADRITHISTGGGASLEFLGGQELPGVAALHATSER